MTEELSVGTDFEQSFHVSKDNSLDYTQNSTFVENLGQVTKGLGTAKAIFLIFRSLVGIGILTMPHQINEFGVVASLIFYPIIAAMVLYALDCMVITANDLEYYDQR